MLDITEIKKYYPANLHKFERGLLREYLQYHILAILFEHKLGKKLSFLGGTALRVVYNLNRFSEDIDFDNKNLSYEEFIILGNYLKNKLQKIGFIVEISYINKSAMHCNIKFPDLLYKNNISSIQYEKILIQIDTFDQKVNYNSNVFILNKFELYDQILVTPKEVILSQKLWTVTQRSRLKGRDFYDIMYLSQNTSPDLNFLEAKFGTANIIKIKRTILEQLNNADFEFLARDVSPFLENPEDANKIKLFPQFLAQQLN